MNGGWRRIYTARDWSEAQALTRAAPTLASEGISVGSGEPPLVAYSIVVQANSGQTLSGAGTVECWLYDSVYGWHRPGTTEFDVTSMASASGLRTVEFSGFTVPGPYPGSRILYAAKGITVSSGTVLVGIKATVDLSATTY